MTIRRALDDRPTEAAPPTDRQNKRRAEAAARSAPTEDPNPDWTLSYLSLIISGWPSAPHHTLFLVVQHILCARSAARTSPPTNTSVRVFIFWCLLVFLVSCPFILSLSLHATYVHHPSLSSRRVYDTSMRRYFFSIRFRYTSHVPTNTDRYRSAPADLP
ncbi:hypothetical protein DFH08DRAFT_361061 [Mycena albidolilacea]|uniref:Uncharacterized protein n=1 Tax=Mycena albidolilacea TaxID=1033008 RepID=A0AAD7F0Y3_9AGAR|nr:hypothetical protein DFH08DRAFT_361061 [Mycena albidolilacea]